MYRLPLAFCIALSAVATTYTVATAATLEYTFTVPFDVKSGGTVAGESVANGAAAGRQPALSVLSCAVGPASLSYSTATGSATGATGSGTTSNVLRSPATVVVTVDAEPRAANGVLKDGAGGVLQPVKPGGYYTCWGTFASGQTPVNFLPTTKLPATSAQGGLKT
jgi:hypothetical protein